MERENKMDLGPENRRHFWNAHAMYCKKYEVLAKDNKKAAEQVTEFDRWRRYLGLGLDGKLCRAKVAAAKSPFPRSLHFPTPTC
jgi:hypothetical protein